MDIKDILSPTEQEAPRSISSTPNTPKRSPFRSVQRTHSGPAHTVTAKYGPGSMALPQAAHAQANIPVHIIASANQNVSSPLISPVPSSNLQQYTRASSTQSIETLADLAALQNHQPLKSTPLIRGRSYENQGSPSFASVIPAALTSNPRASFDINMMEAPRQRVRTDFATSSLPKEKQEKLTQLVEYIQEKPSAYESHVERIKILHDGLVEFIYPPSDPHARRDPRSYDLLQDLRDAREQLEKLFAVGEDLWNDWLQDESLLAQTAEERIAVVENCRRAIEEEAGSVKLWLAYGDWVHHCYNWAHHQSGDAEVAAGEEKLIGRELFTWQMVSDVWQEAVEQTSHDLAQSHLVWNKYIELHVPNLQDKLTPDKVTLVRRIFDDRLRTPHMQWDDSFQAFSNFVSTNLNSQYEHIMVDTNRLSSSAKEFMSSRREFELEIQQAQETGDRDAEYQAFTNYLTWEQATEKRRKPDSESINALYQRMELRFATDANTWEDHVVFLGGTSKSSVLTLLERATKHCPWSGALWSHYLLTSERIGQTFQETEEIKHKATNTGILEAAGIEEVISVYAAWCSYLRRRSAHPDGNDEDIDVAEMGIRASIESVSGLGVNLGLGETPGSFFRLRRIYITFLTESGRWDNAQDEFAKSIQHFGNSYEFWMQFYHWEMMRWRMFLSNEHKDNNGSDSGTEPPHLATAVLQQAVERPNLDYPEVVMKAFVTHCEEYEDAKKLQQALFKLHKLQKTVLMRRQIEVAQAAEAVIATQPADPSSTNALVQGEKRKRESDLTDGVESASKKFKNEEIAHESVEQTATTDLKRDRENATILVENLPEDIAEARLRQYFSNCGVVRSLKVLEEDDSLAAIIEFEDDEAANYALSRDGQEFEGAILSVVLDTGSTLYLTNYKPAADEAYIRSLLESFGEIVSVRFPSLQGNKKRRFCYVQFKLPTQAKAATARNGDEIDGLPLVCKISSPANRKSREPRSNTNDGRTIFVGQLNFKLTEEELEKVFSKYGDIDTIRMPRAEKEKNRNKGIAFITYRSKESASEAMAMHGVKLKDRNIKVSETSSNARRSVPQNTASPQPGVNGKASTSVERDGNESDLWERQIFLTDIPDTVNESRLRAVGNQYGQLYRVILKTNHQGAILEYSTVAEAGEAALKLDGHEIDPGRTIRVVTESEMQATDREKKADHQPSKQKSSTLKATPIGLFAPIRRPGQPGRKGGHLGQRTTPSMSTHDSTAATDGVANGTGKKSNNEFRAMLNKT